MRKRIVITLLWLVGIIFPAAWLGRFSSRYQGVFDWLFGPPWMHIVMHALLYAVLAVLILAIFQVRLSWRSLGFGLAALLLVGVLQESFQALGQGIQPWAGAALTASLFDLGVDLSGGLLGMGMRRVWEQFHPL